MAQVVECLLSKAKALSSNHSTNKNETKQTYGEDTKHGKQKSDICIIKVPKKNKWNRKKTNIQLKKKNSSLQGYTF
jgi:hypothetical protein